MVETGKRIRSQNGSDGDYKNQKRRTDNDDKGGDKLVVYRILCPDGVIGAVIGKGGKVINSIRQETRAKVKVVDPFPGAKERVITIYCYVKETEEVEVDEVFIDRKPYCPAQDALLRVHAAIANAVETMDSEKNRKDGECSLLVPTSQSASIIGKSGATIKKLRSRTMCNIKVIAKDATDPSHSCAMEFDNFLQITGESEAVMAALFAVSAIMYKFTPREEIPLETTVPEVPPSIIIPSDVPIYSAAAFYTGSDPAVHSRTVPSVIGAHAPELPAYADTGSSLPIYSSSLPVVSAYGGASQSCELTVRVLCPSDKIGRVIGKGGSSIKSVRQASGARVQVDDGKNKHNECVITVMSTEAMNDLKSMAVEAVLLLQEKINEDADTVTIQLLVPSKNIGCIIGKNGSIIKEIRKRTKADIQISKGEKPKGVDETDELVVVAGEVKNVRDALVQIVLRLRDHALKDKDDAHNPSDTQYASSSLTVPSLLPSIGSVNPLGYEQRTDTRSGLGILPSDGLYKYGSLSMRDDSYGSLPSYSSKLYAGLAPPLTLEILIPANAVHKVMGKGGANMENIRQISGAVIEISESKSSRGDRVAYVTGTSEQKRSAENLIQAFIMAA
ncbi:hypothetical protein Nepgr_029847 [Nepenthes gracilis]|uniref:K Homology domain-containing protein n=1 Tax=Nepenthes gracilis TaxID=150966 RepID=A0AAD3Y5H6_NEPGR|nr:hypothetical protein Nepgr_029847 [Nepenthes gracilis]